MPVEETTADEGGGSGARVRPRVWARRQRGRATVRDPRAGAHGARLARRPLRRRAAALSRSPRPRARRRRRRRFSARAPRRPPGLYAEARRRLEAAAAAHPGDLPLRDALMRLYEATGDRAAWKPLVDASYADWNGGQVDRTKPADLMAIATAVRLDENWKDANDVLRDAVRADRREVARQPRLGGAAAREAQRRRRRDLVPRGAQGRSRQPRRARRPRRGPRSTTATTRPRRAIEIARALAVNPAHAGALALRAELALDAEDFRGGAGRRGGHPPHQPARSGRRPRRGRGRLPARRPGRASPAPATSTSASTRTTAGSSPSWPRRCRGSAATRKRAPSPPMAWPPIPTTPAASPCWRRRCCGSATRRPASTPSAGPGSATRTTSAPTTCSISTRR